MPNEQSVKDSGCSAVGESSVNLPWMGPVCQPPMDRPCVNLPGMCPVCQPLRDGSCVSTSLPAAQGTAQRTVRGEPCNAEFWSWQGCGCLQKTAKDEASQNSNLFVCMELLAYVAAEGGQVTLLCGHCSL